MQVEYGSFRCVSMESVRRNKNREKLKGPTSQGVAFDHREPTESFRALKPLAAYTTMNSRIHGGAGIEMRTSAKPGSRQPLGSVSNHMLQGQSLPVCAGSRQEVVLEGRRQGRPDVLRCSRGNEGAVGVCRARSSRVARVLVFRLEHKTILSSSETRSAIPLRL